MTMLGAIFRNMLPSFASTEYAKYVIKPDALKENSERSFNSVDLLALGLLEIS